MMVQNRFLKADAGSLRVDAPVTTPTAARRVQRSQLSGSLTLRRNGRVCLHISVDMYVEHCGTCAIFPRMAVAAVACFQLQPKDSNVLRSRF